ncbi:hypothetical protein PQC07_gp003 [Aeromonas phage D3]|uniref:Uncharacterized protein n=2 Tax=Ludhianavirus TaxID=3044751 RepID=A0A514TVE7_9CAUD|nr:hypothetical protein PQC07_gp003 [Aeromonas phage D3]YP_010668751.1 hypothetical protein PQC08_gp003 [Aeromonas phage D6]QDJ97001.1 hypothetical protein D3_0003 [Aeromonas phage D3]QDJ97430.1 hypothetical protein D6_0003 [Aeromonas phage D6]QEP52307.1 hypothetical protein D9_0100 [Aeromonas phage D9]
MYNGITGGAVKFRLIGPQHADGTELSDYEQMMRAMRQDEQILTGMEEFEPETLFGPEVRLTQYGGMESYLDNIEYMTGFEALSPNFVYDRDNAVKDIFDGLVEDLVIDQRWVSKLRRFVYGFATKDNDHTEFFGTPYLGTHRIVFKTADRNNFFSDIIDVDEVRLRDELIRTRWVNKDFKVSSDAFNLSIVYLMHKVWVSNLPKNMKDEALINLVMLFHYRIMTSIMNHYFSYLVKPSVAQTAYNKLSMKFDIKRFGSWNELFKARGEFVINPKTGIHFDTFTKLNDDKRIVYMVNDMESRLKGVINDYTKVLYEIKDNVDLVATDNGLAMMDGEVNIKDVQKHVNKYRNYINGVVNDGTSFYKQELVGYAARAVDDSRTSTQFEDKLTMVIRDFPAQYNHKKGEDYREFVDDCVIHLFEYLSSNSIRHTDLKNVVYKLRGAYTSNKSSNALLHKLRRNGDEIIRAMTGIRTQYTVSSLRTALMLYIVIRTLTLEYYK